MVDRFMELALEQASKCPQSETAYSVGCIIVRHNAVISSGYSREADPKIHAEESALAKLGFKADNCIVYTTMEPCSRRASRPKACAQLILESGARHVVYGCREPSFFVERCEGTELLKTRGIEVVELIEYRDAALVPNSHIGKQNQSKL